MKRGKVRGNVKKTYAVLVCGTYTDGMEYSYYVKAVRSLFVDVTGNIRDAATFRTSKVP